jgi:hypothetical protein
MRGGTVNRNKVQSFIALIRLLRQLNIITRWQYRIRKENCININPLVHKQSIFVDEFKV